MLPGKDQSSHRLREESAAGRDLPWGWAAIAGPHPRISGPVTELTFSVFADAFAEPGQHLIQTALKIFIDVTRCAGLFCSFAANEYGKLKRRAFRQILVVGAFPDHAEIRVAS